MGLKPGISNRSKDLSKETENLYKKILRSSNKNFQQILSQEDSMIIDQQPLLTIEDQAISQPLQLPPQLPNQEVN